MDLSMPPSKGLVLVVEDEPLMRMVAAGFIQDAGYETLEVADADQAIAVLEARNDIRIVFPDIRLPGSSIAGLKLAHAVRHRWPPVERVFTSALARPKKAALPARGRFLPKPYRPEELTAVLGQFG